MIMVSAVLIVRDEEALLGNCLASLEGVADEVVVVDTGSSDGTAALAASLGARCFDFPWQDDFAAARNFALEQATGRYALVIDADERIENPEEAGRLLRTFAEEQGEDVVGTVEILNVTGVGAEAQEVVDHTERFFLREGFEYAGAVHEQVVARAGTKRSAPTGVRLRHLGYAQAHDDPNHKAHRNIRLLQQELDAHPDDEYFRFQLGKAHFTLKQYAEAVEGLEGALAAILFVPGQPPLGRLGPVAREVLTDLVVSLAYAYANLGRMAEAESLLARHVALGHPGVSRADFHHARGYVYLHLGDVARSKEAYTRSMEFGPAGEDVRGTATFRSAYHLGLLAEAEQDLSRALAHYLQSLQFRPDYGPTISRCIDIITEHGVALPPEVWQTADHAAFGQAYVDKLSGTIANGDAGALQLLVQAAAGLSPELLARCREHLVNKG